MLKKLFLLILGMFLFTGIYYYNLYSKNRVNETPYTYSFTKSYEENFLKTHAEEIKNAQSATLLIIGDRMGESFSPFIDNLKMTLGPNFKSTTENFAYNWSVPNEGLFRSLHKIKMLKKLPPVIVYMGASSELFEKRFDVKDKKNILHNFSIFDDENSISLILTFPWLSKIFNKPLTFFDLSEYREYKNTLPAQLKIEEKELAFKFFEYELQEMINYIHERKSNLILVTTPINLEVPPKETCPHASNDKIVLVQQEIANAIEEGAFKQAFPKAKELSEITFSNAHTYYLLGRSALGIGDLKTARESLLKASVFDCTNWRGNAVYNSIIKKLAARNLTQIVDFEQILTSQISQDGLYFDDIFPQNLFYHKLVSELGFSLKKIFGITK